MEKKPRLKKYKFTTRDEKGENRETFIRCYYSKKEAIEYCKEWQELNPLKHINVYLGY